MPKPTVADHRNEIRALVQEMTPAQFTDAEIDLNLSNALNVLSGFVPYLEKITLTGLSADQTALDLSADCPAGEVVEVIPAGLAPGSPALTEFRPRGGELLLPSPVGATGADVVFRSRYRHDGVEVDWYPPHLRGALYMLASALLVLGRARELAETDFDKCTALTAQATKFFDTALAIFGLPGGQA